MISEKKPDRIYSFDILKLIAAVCIALFHYHGMFHVDNVVIDKLIYNSVYFVEMFFVFSGYFTAEKEHDISHKRFMPFFLQRIGRLMPLYWILLIIQYVCVYITEGKITQAMAVDNFVANLVLSPLLLRKLDCFINEPAWYLSVLFICFAMEWMVLFCTKRKCRDSVPIYVVLVMVGMACNMAIPLKGFNTLSFVMNVMGRGTTAFFSGCLVKHISNIFYGRKAEITGLVMILICMCTMVTPFSLCLNTGIMVSIILYPGLILLLLNTNMNERLSKIKYVKEMGAISYTVYISDRLFIGLNVLLYKYCPSLAVYQSSVTSMIISTAVLVLLCVPLHYCVEVPLAQRFMSVVNRRIEEYENVMNRSEV